MTGTSRRSSPLPSSAASHQTLALGPRQPCNGIRRTFWIRVHKDKETYSSLSGAGRQTILTRKLYRGVCLRYAAMRSGSPPPKSHQRRFLGLNSVKPWLNRREMSCWHRQCDRRNYFSRHGAEPFFCGSGGEIHICFPLLSLCASAGGLPTMS